MTYLIAILADGSAYAGEDTLEIRQELRAKGASILHGGLQMWAAAVLEFAIANREDLNDNGYLDREVSTLAIERCPHVWESKTYGGSPSDAHERAVMCKWCGVEYTEELEALRRIEENLLSTSIIIESSKKLAREWDKEIDIEEGHEEDLL